MERTTLVEELAYLDAEIAEATRMASDAPTVGQQDEVIAEIMELRTRRAEIQAKLDAALP